MNKKKKIIAITSVILALAIGISLCVTLILGTSQGELPEDKVFGFREKPEDAIRVMSFNIRCTNVGTRFTKARTPDVIATVLNGMPDSMGVQEATPKWMKILTEELGDYYAWVGEGRDGNGKGEYSAIFYLKDKYNLIDSGTFWLSETPEVMSKDWGAAHYRICTYIILRDRATSEEFVVFNTHLDHVSDEARINGIKVVLDKIAEFNNIPAFLMGDLNAEEDSKTYKSATENFFDTKYQTENTMTSCTYQAWGKQLDKNCIDYILVSKTGFKTNSYKVVTDTYDGVYSSDHFPLSVSLSFE